ncbi:protein phosphatase 2C 29 [Citrus clementina]|uniref:protein phosphatase 2C 29 n=1 Tax=Citrus clementina TaxID=85681 RepID=UPI000CED1D58|nr:protein phosphatase 2C 29 [Citrus x clementina]
MGSGLSSLFPCFKPVNHTNRTQPDQTQQQPDLIFTSSEPLDETLGHSFCYVRSSNRFLSPTPSDRFVSPSQSLRFSPSRAGPGPRGLQPETGFRAISGASVSANTATPRTVLQLDNIYDDATEPTCAGGYGVKSSIVNVSGFESTSSFSAMPLQPVPRGGAYDASERGPFFLSGPLGALSGPLDQNAASEPGGGRVHFSAPLGGLYVKRKKKRGILGMSGIRKAFHDKKRPWVVPVPCLVLVTGLFGILSSDTYWFIGLSNQLLGDVDSSYAWNSVLSKCEATIRAAPRLTHSYGHIILFFHVDILTLWELFFVQIVQEIIRIKNEHPDDSQCIVNDRVKGRLKVTRAFGAGFLKKPKLNDTLLEMFRNEYIGTAPYISCTPSLCHLRLCPRDQFLVLSSDGLYQYLTNQEVVSLVESFMEKFPDGDPAQHLIEELLLHAAKRAGMDLHELLDIPQGDRRKYHDDVTVMVISLEGRIWKSSGKYL